METTFLQQIIAYKQELLQAQKKAVPLELMLSLEEERLSAPTHSLKQALLDHPGGILAEFKRKSPLTGWIQEKATVDEIIPSYERAGAVACSIVTDSRFFGGSLGDLHRARQLTHLPLLCKDFIVDTYQLFQAKAMGADAVSLIAECLTKEDCMILAGTAHSLRMEVLLEIHHPEELVYLTPDMDLVGIDSRDLASLEKDLKQFDQLVEHVRRHTAWQEDWNPLLIAESGLQDAETIRHLSEKGFHGFLVGEALMQSESPGEALRQLI